MSGCANPARIPGPSTPAAPPSVRVGDRWRYAKIDLYRGRTLDEQTMRVAAVEPLLHVEVTGADGRRLTAELYLGPWNVVQETAWEQVQAFGSPCPLLPPRLEPGAVESWQGTWQTPEDSWHYRWSVRTVAHDWERVETPAGVFEALRVSRRIAFSHPDLRRTDCGRIETLWYAPKANRWVRREVDGACMLPGLPPTRLNEDRLAWVLLDHLPA